MADLSSSTNSSLFFRKLPRELRDKVYSLLGADSCYDQDYSQDYCCSAEIYCRPEPHLLRVNKQFLGECKEQCERDLRVEITIGVSHFSCVFEDPPDDFLKNISVSGRIRHMVVLVELDAEDVMSGKGSELWDALSSFVTEEILPACLSLEVRVAVDCLSGIGTGSDRYPNSAAEAQAFTSGIRNCFATPSGFKVSVKVSVHVTCPLFKVWYPDKGRCGMRSMGYHRQHPHNNITFEAKPDEGPYSWYGLALEMVSAGSFEEYQREEEEYWDEYERSQAMLYGSWDAIVPGSE